MRCFIAFLCFVIISGISPCFADDDLIAHWPLTSDAKDISGRGNHGRIHGVRFEKQLDGRPAALFDGRSARIEVKNSKSLDLGTGNFTISAWINTSTDTDDAVGDILSKFAADSRTGFTFSLKTHAGMTSSQSNARHLSFGIDAGKSQEGWTDCGRPGESILPFAMCVYDGSLYVGTCVPGSDQSGHVYRYGGGENWIDCGSPYPANTVSCLAVYRGELYAAVSKYRLRGSALVESENETPGGHVFRYAGDQQWIDCGKLGAAGALNGMVVFRDRLYVSAMYSPGFWRYEGEGQWIDCGSPDGKRMESLTVYNGHIYATGYDEGAIYRYTAGENESSVGKWDVVGKLPGVTQTYAFATYRGDLYVSTWPNASVYRFDGVDQWTNFGRLGEELEVMGLAVYNGKLYGGTLPLANVYRYDDDKRWTLTGRLDHTPNVKYRRVWNMAVFGGKLYAGVLPSGRVLSYEAGKNVTYDTALRAGWRHVVAQHDGTVLRLYVDGKLVASSTKFTPADFDIGNAVPLTIGLGAHDYFCGGMRDVRIYSRALSQKEIANLAQ